MLGISNIATYLPPARISNLTKLHKFGIDDSFIKDKIGVSYRSIREPEDQTSDLCVKAFHALEQKESFDRKAIQALFVVTQNPDMVLPNVAAIVHGKLDLSPTCAAFDISLGCSGYVYGISTAFAFMREHGLTHGLLFTAEPFSNIVNPEDKNTSLLFGDAATVTLITETPRFVPGKFAFGTIGQKREDIRMVDGKVFMNGSAVVKSVMRTIPDHIKHTLSLNNIGLDQVDSFVFHQASRFIINLLKENLALPAHKVPIDFEDYGNTVSSSIPLILEKVIEDETCRTIFISGFGVGFSYGNGLFYRPS